MDEFLFPTRFIRLKPGEPWPDDDTIADGLTPGQRMELAWELSLQAHYLAGGAPVPAQMQKDVVHIVRAKRAE